MNFRPSAMYPRDSTYIEITIKTNVLRKSSNKYKTLKKHVERAPILQRKGSTDD
jgi:hypothetical protein